jgi:Ca2+-binding EF-hand superfamily protein
MNRSHADDAEDTSSAGDGVAMPAVTDALSASQLDTLKDLFTVFDQQNLGHMPVTELRVALRMAGVETNRDEAHGLIAMFCADRDAGFTLDEFLSVVNEKIRERPADYRDNFLATVFDAIDSEEAGELDYVQLSKWANVVGAAERESTSVLAASPTVRSNLHAAPDHLRLPTLEDDITKPGGLERFMADLGLDPNSRLTREAFVNLFANSDTIV